LRNKEVGTGDLFLFFGWFKKYASRGKELHHIFGWLQISEIICGNKNIKKYLDSINISHPHGHQEYTSNTIYISNKNLTIGNKTTNLKGHGVFKYSAEDLILTSHLHNKSMWKLPENYFKDFLSPVEEDGFFMRRFPTDKKNFLVDTNTGPWQEAILDSENNPKVIDWAIKLISEHG
jgi:hypothetical protein